MLKNGWAKIATSFGSDHAVFWGHLSRLTNLLVVMNISMFFLTGLVAKGYYYTFYSLICLGAVGTGILIPTPYIRRLWYYGLFLLAEFIGIYFLVASVIFYVRHSPG